MLLWIEAGLSVVAVTMALIAPRFGTSWFEKWERRLGYFAEHKRLSIVAVGVLALALRAAVLPVEPIPVPGMHDEFSNLLMADTFAHGRVANPAHPMWIHFETFHVIQKPTYVSKYFPAQGLFLAIGQVMFGHPFWGVWLSCGLMCATICWMLQGWLSPQWALLGGVLAVIRLGTFSYWADSYLGGAVAALGGALVLGALPRIKRQQRVRDAVTMGLGLAILATGRPYEGLFFSLPIGIALFSWIFQEATPGLTTVMRRILLPIALVLAFTSGAMLYYFWRTTVSPFRTPYSIYMEADDPVPVFPWQKMRSAPSYNHSVIQKFYLQDMAARYQSVRRNPVAFGLVKAILVWEFFLGPVLTLPLLMLGVALPYGMSYKDLSQDTRLLLIVFAASFLAIMLPIYFFPHYAAPLTGTLYALVLLAMRRVRRWKWCGKATGLFTVRAVPIICMILLLLRVTARPLHIPLPSRWPTLGDQLLERARVRSEMNKHHDKQLLLVRYSTEHDPGEEWVYNGADIDGSKVVWARDMGWERNMELIRYFKDRQAWLVEPDEIPVRVSPYPTERPGAKALSPLSTLTHKPSLAQWNHSCVGTK